MNTPIVEASNAAYALHCEASQLRANGQNEEAAGKWAECIALVPDEPAYLREYADCLARLSRWDEDLHYALLAATFEPSNAEAWALAGAACGQLGRQDEAIRYYNRADAIAPNSPMVLWNRSLSNLLHGRYEEGWREYEWRFSTSVRRRTIKPMWNGQPGHGRTLLIWAEQGLGDTLQFARFVKRAKARWGGHVVFEVQRELLTMFHGRGDAIGFDELATMPVGGGVPYADFEHIALLSLPLILGINDEAEFWTGPYIDWVDTKPRAGAWQVGVCWQGKAAHPNDKDRSIDAKAFFDAVIKPFPDVNFYAINPDSQLPDCPNCHNPSLGSFNDTGEGIADLDLVITVDTSVAHLAGAMGKPVWLLLRCATDWRWCLNHPVSSPWYPSAVLFRQPEYGDWKTPLCGVASALAAKVGAA